MKTAIAALLALGLVTGQASAKSLFDGIQDSAPRSEIFTDIGNSAPRSVFDDIRDTAPRSFGDLRDSAPRSDGVYGTLEQSAP